jgi:hypothetical protein
VYGERLDLYCGGVEGVGVGVGDEDEDEEYIL